MTDGDVAVSLAEEVGLKLPASYLSFLDQLEARDGADDEDGPTLDYNGQGWQPHTRRRLSEIVPHRRREKAFPYAHETARHAELLRAADADHDGEASSALVEQGFSLERLARGFCVGSDENGDPLFVDPDNGGVYLFSHDGMDLEPWAESLDQLLAGSQDSQ